MKREPESLNIGYTWAVFHAIGRVLVLYELVNMIDIGIDNSTARFFKIFGWILSGSEEEDFMECIVDIILVESNE